jgi:hypothetical protein
MLEKRDVSTGDVVVLNNRIPAGAASGAVPAGGIPSDGIAILRRMWTDHGVDDADKIRYRVTAVTADGITSRRRTDLSASPETPVTSRILQSRHPRITQVTASRKADYRRAEVVQDEARGPGSAGAALPCGTSEAPSCVSRRRGSARQRIFAALYEVNDQGAHRGLKAFGPRGHVLLEMVER